MRMSRPESLLPPRRKNWKKGTPQVGAFLRTEDGGVLEMAHDEATLNERAFVLALMWGLEFIPKNIVEKVRQYADKRLEDVAKPRKQTRV